MTSDETIRSENQTVEAPSAPETSQQKQAYQPKRNGFLKHFRLPK